MVSILKHRSREITFSCVREEGYNCFAFVFGAFCKLSGCPYCSARGNSHKYAFLAGELSACFKGIFILYGDDLIIDFRIECVGDKSGADTLDLMGTCDTL